MIELISLPDSISAVVFTGLIVLSFFTSMLSASIGIGGGTILLAVMAQVVPIKAIIPVHGLVQLGSNFGRALILLPSVHWAAVCWFLLGSLIGAFVGGHLVVSLPVNLLKILLGAFILFSVWGPKFSSNSKNKSALAIGGFLSTLLTMFVGATGPFVLALYKALNLPRLALVATNAASLVIQHLLKVLIFGLLGFAYSPYLALIILMILSGFIGTIIGRRFLLKINEKVFQQVLRIVLTALAARLLYTALF